MKIYERKMEHDNGEKYVLITFEHHRAEIFRAEIPIKHERCAALRFAKAKEKVIDEFLETFHGQKYTKKEILKAWAETDNYFKDVFKQLYPKGGSRKNAGRKQGSLQKTPKSERTERFTMAITKKEKSFLLQCLETFRNSDDKNKLISLMVEQRRNNGTKI